MHKNGNKQHNFLTEKDNKHIANDEQTLEEFSHHYLTAINYQHALKRNNNLVKCEPKSQIHKTANNAH